MPLSRWPPRRLLMVMGFVVLFLLTGAAFIYFSKTAQLQTWQQQLTAARQALAQDREQVGQQSAYAADYAAAKQKLAVLEEKVVPSEFIATFLDQAEELANQTHLRIGSFQPAEPPPQPEAPEGEEEPAEAVEEKPAFPSHEVDLTLQGNFNEVLTFLDQLQQFRKAVAVENVEIRGSTGGAENPAAVSATLHLIVYEMDSGEPV